MKRPRQEDSSLETEELDLSIDVGREEARSRIPRSLSPTMSSLVQARKKRRGIIEKRRRDRINSCLSELRHLVPAASAKQSCQLRVKKYLEIWGMELEENKALGERDPGMEQCHSIFQRSHFLQGCSKLEKAEILQMTVDHLRMICATGGTGLLDARAIAVDYRSIGFRECLAEATRYLDSLKNENSRADPVRLRLLSHLNNYAAEMDTPVRGASLLLVPSGPKSLLWKCSSPVGALSQVPWRHWAPGMAIWAASSVVCPSPTLRAPPMAQAPNAVALACPNSLSSRMASSAPRRPPVVTSAASVSASHASVRDTTFRGSRLA